MKKTQETERRSSKEKPKSKNKKRSDRGWDEDGGGIRCGTWSG